jgi:hypothetical protein
MRNSYTRVRSLVFVAGLLTVSGAAGRPSEAAIITVEFSGTETGVSSPRTFSGSFVYDSTQNVSSTAGLFNFMGSAKDHAVAYKIGTSPEVSGSQMDCEPYKITTSSGGKKTIQLKTTVSGNMVTVTLPTGAILSQSRLPTCGAIPGTPLAGSTFAVTGATSFTGTITSLMCH